jgi:ribosome-binding factor A
MASSRRERDLLRSHCDQLHEDDCIDPREYFSRSNFNQKQNRKAKQLCRQVAETLGLVLTGDTSDDLLAELSVVSVVPAPDSSRLLVTVVTHAASDREEIERRLAHHGGRLRCEVARAITRKKAPALAFNVIPLGPNSESQS